MLSSGNFEGVNPTYVPWAGVDDNGNIHGIDGMGIAVAENGNIGPLKFGPSIAAADMNGDGKPDLVLADSTGFFWFFPNSGTPQKPVFTQGEVIPIWLGEDRVEWDTEGVSNVVPRIQLVDFDDTKKLDILVGTYVGKLYRIHNLGSTTQPAFKPSYVRDPMLINTRKHGVLWCNYLAPFMTKLFGSQTFGSQNPYDLVMGEGTYSANSIYLLHNTNSSANPAFDEDHRLKMIPGMGLEQLTPCVLDWNNDGKPDVLTGDRTGFLTLYLNNSKDPDQPPTFAPGTHITVGGVENFGNATTVSLADLTGNKLPNLLIGRDDGTILYALNTGKIGAPEFTTPATPLTGVLPPGWHYTAPTAWYKDQAWGAPDELIACVNPTLEPGFTFPEGETSKYALKSYVWPVKNILFPERFYPRVEDELREHMIIGKEVITLEVNKHYRLHFWAKGENNDVRVQMVAARIRKDGFHGSDFTNPVNVGTSWTENSFDIRMDNRDDPATPTWPYNVAFRFTGQGTFYIDDVQVQPQL